MICKEILNTIGLIVSFTGSFLVLLVTVKDSGEYLEEEPGQEEGERWYSVIMKHPKRLKCGIVFMVIGFLLSLCGSIISYF